MSTDPLKLSFVALADIVHQSVVILLQTLVINYEQNYDVGTSLSGYVQRLASLY